MGPAAALLPCGTRLHLQHGPIDLIVGADGARDVAFQAATDRFRTVLPELVAELADLRSQLTGESPRPRGAVAQRMDCAARPHCRKRFVTRMAAVAGSVADEILSAMLSATPLRRAYVNNGGDIALHLTSEERFSLAISSVEGQPLGQIALTGLDTPRGIATSGRGGRSLSLGIADSVTVLARTAAEADVAATLIANDVDLPGHPAITRRPAQQIQDDSDLGDRPVVVACGRLNPSNASAALQRGLKTARAMARDGLIEAASLFLQGQSVQTGTGTFSTYFQTRSPELA